MNIQELADRQKIIQEVVDVHTVLKAINIIYSNF